MRQTVLEDVVVTRRGFLRGLAAFAAATALSVELLKAPVVKALKVPQDEAVLTIEKLRRAFDLCREGSEVPEVIWVSNDFYARYRASLDALEDRDGLPRGMLKFGKSGFPHDHTLFMGVPVAPAEEFQVTTILPVMRRDYGYVGRI